LATFKPDTLVFTSQIPLTPEHNQEEPILQ